MHSKIIVTINKVTKEYVQKKKSIKKALQGVSLDIYQGEIISLLGVNGAGKTTLSSIIATLRPPTSGDIFFRGQSVYQDIISYRRVLGFCPQIPNLNPSLTMRENLQFAGCYYQVPQMIIEQRIREISKKFFLNAHLDKYAHELSGGYKQRFMIARELMHDAQILILDEPTVALDPHVRRQLWGYIKELKAQGVTVILTTHYIDEAEELSDRVCILDQGLVKFLDTPANLKEAFKKGRLEEVFLHITQENQKSEEEQ